MTDEYDTVDHHGPMSPAEFLFVIGKAMGWPTDDEEDDGTNGQDRESYTDDQDRDEYVPAEEDIRGDR